MKNVRHKCIVFIVLCENCVRNHKKCGIIILLQLSIY